VFPWVVNKLKSPNVLGPNDDNSTDLAALHQPKLPRNKEMDVYNPDNAVNVELTYGQINTYYKTMRCLVKGKTFIPEHEKESKHVATVSKKDLLCASQEDALQDTVVLMHLSKAKAIHINTTLLLVERIGMHNEAKLKSEAEQEYQRYCIGK
jgi:hypothetical protein